jgi:hypothetical protein
MDSMLNFSDITSKFHTTTMFINSVPYIIVGMFIIYLHTESHICSSNGSFVITVKVKAK